MAPSTKQRHRYQLHADLNTQAEQERFEALVAASGLSKADYIRRCCLEPKLIITPSQNITDYGLFAQVQVLVTEILALVNSEQLPTVGRHPFLQGEALSTLQTAVRERQQQLLGLAKAGSGHENPPSETGT